MSQDLLEIQTGAEVFFYILKLAKLFWYTLCGGDIRKFDSCHPSTNKSSSRTCSIGLRIPFVISRRLCDKIVCLGSQDCVDTSGGMRTSEFTCRGWGAYVKMQLGMLKGRQSWEKSGHCFHLQSKSADCALTRLETCFIDHQMFWSDIISVCAKRNCFYSYRILRFKFLLSWYYVASVMGIQEVRYH